jgi:hypothetical protein
MEKQEFITALSDEKRRIQEALLSVGYHAHIVKFYPDIRGMLPRLEIEAFPARESDNQNLG